MNRRRLEHTAREVLPYVEPEKLRMSSWFCGTAACAFGHECMSEFGKSEGLELHQCGPVTILPVFADYDGLEAAQAYYGIAHDVAEWIFMPYSYDIPASPAEVAARIESLLACES